MNNYLEKFGSNFIVAAFIPSLTFVTLCAAFFGRFIPTFLTSSLQIPSSTLPSLGQYGLIILMLAIMLGFSLSSLKIFILKVLEGYVVLEHITFLRRSERKRERKLRKELDRVRRRKERLLKLSDSSSNPLIKQRFTSIDSKLNIREMELATEYQVAFPLNPKEVMPTRFGNILKAAEYYPLDRYGIDSVPMWPRLVYAIDKDYYQLIEQSLNSLTFIVNSAILSIAFALVTLLTGIWLLLDYQPEFWVYFVAAGASIIAAYTFHRASLFSVSEYGNMIRSAYDLFRFKLLEALYQELPEDSDSEKGIWLSISEFYNIGNYRGPLPLTYLWDTNTAGSTEGVNDGAIGTASTNETIS